MESKINQETPRLLLAMGAILLAVSPFSFSQTRDRRLEDARSDIALLKRIVKEQDRRIADLEKSIKALQEAQAAPADKPAAEAPAKTAKLTLVIPWQVPAAWTQIRGGMSRAQVEDILGPPTRVDSVIDYQTLVYTGDVAGSGILTGRVKLTDDRVSQIDPPNF